VEEWVHGSMTARRSTATGGGRRFRAAALLLLVPILVVSGCSSKEHASTASNQSSGGGESAKKDEAKTSAAKITVSPAADAQDVEPAEHVKVTADNGTLTDVAVTDSDGKKVDGKLSDDKKSWQAEDELTPSETYTVSAKATDSDGVEATSTAKFSTVKARKLVRTSVVPLNGETVGVGQPIAVKFNTTIAKQYRAAVEKQMQVSSSPTVDGSWNWLDGQRLHFRPAKYWPAGTKVQLKIGIKNLKAGDRVYGGESRTIKFTIGRSMVSVVNINSHTMTVTRNGQLLKTVPISTGKKGFETRGGIKVVLEKTQHKVMDATTVGIPKTSPEYYRLDVYYAVRLTLSGEFAHAAPWSVGSQGRANVSHGCVGMSNENAAWFFSQAMRGDVIQVIGNPGKLMELDNGFGDWNVPYGKWKAGSALA
jgi:lipoprotein-anchoring transpeptidase ErfK/SrfK